MNIIKTRTTYKDVPTYTMNSLFHYTRSKWMSYLDTSNAIDTTRTEIARLTTINYN